MNTNKNNITIENWLNSDSNEHDSDSYSTMPLFSDNNSSIASDLSYCSSLSNMSYIEEIYLDYDTSDSEESNDSQVHSICWIFCVFFLVLLGLKYQKKYIKNSNR